MSQKKLHIISFDVPLPADYGGVIDVFCRAKALKENGLYIILHCFYKKHIPKLDFSELADEVHFYKRKTNFIQHFSFLPYIVKSRINTKLIVNLAKDTFPILAEGHHCAGILLTNKINANRIFIRIHNNEVAYYKALSFNEKNVIKKTYFLIESLKLKNFEKTLKKAKALYCLHIEELKHYLNINQHSNYWRIGIDPTISKPNANSKNQVVYVGNLSVNENCDAVNVLVSLWKKQKIEIPLIIAGKNPTSELIYTLRNNKIELKENPTNEQINQLLFESKYNISYTNQATGMKIKVLNNILKGNICLANDKLVENSDVKEFVFLFNENNLKSLLNKLTIDLDSISDNKNKVEKLYNPLNNIDVFVRNM